MNPNTAAYVQKIEALEKENAEMAEALNQCLETIEDGLETESETEHAWSISDKALCEQGRAILERRKARQS